MGISMEIFLVEIHVCQMELLEGNGVHSISETGMCIAVLPQCYVIDRCRGLTKLSHYIRRFELG